MHDHREPHFSTLKRILRYVRGTLNHGLQLFSSSTTSLIAYSDADRASCPTTRRSTSAADVLLWKRRRVSLGIIIVATAAWLVFERSGLSFLTICSNVLLFLIVLRFLHANYASMRDKQIQTLPELVLSEEMVNYAAASFRIKVNYMLLMAHDITLGKDFRLFFTVCSGLSVAVICPWKFNIFLHACVYSDSVARLPQSTFEEPVYSLIVVDSFQPIKFFLGQLR
ncbi:reticulon-like protein B16 [Tanacetum coccineum]